jgi:hypothetical protein
MSGPLPWRHLETKTEILHMKRRLDMAKLGREAVPQFGDIWELISALEYEDEPPYGRIHNKLKEAMDENSVSAEDEWDWHPQILFMGGDEPMLDQVRESSSDTEQRMTSTSRTKETGLNSDPLLGVPTGEGCCGGCCVV